jgi:MerR family mercuric resistance operon transcriptional regulator
MMHNLTIGQLAVSAGVGVETVRFYQRKGLVEEPENPRSGYRRYPAEAAQRIRFIRQAQEIGFSLREVGELLALRVDRTRSCADVRRHAEAKILEVRRRSMLSSELSVRSLGSRRVAPGWDQPASAQSSTPSTKRDRDE